MYGIAKRTLDLACAAVVLLVSSPVLLAAAVAVRLRLGKPVLFRQKRPGLGGAPFELLKLRTMTEETDALGELLPDGERLTPLGALLRRTSLDELPQLFNVLRGDMSLVGPRPLLMRYLGRYTTYQARRHEVRPGITGWSQVRGRNALDWETKLDLDVWYVDHRSFTLDLRILRMTASKVLSGSGVSHGEGATMPEFLGTHGGTQTERDGDG